MKLFDPEYIQKLQAEYQKWHEDVYKKRLNGEKYRNRKFGWVSEETKPEFKTGSDEFTVKPVYTPDDLKDPEAVELPGQYPFTRGIDPAGYRAFRWALSYYTGFGSSKSANERYRAMYAGGAREMRLALDLPTQIGLDSDHHLAKGEVGKVGLALDTIQDMEEVWEGLPLQEIYTGTVGNCIGPWALAMFYVAAERKGVDPNKVRVLLQNDPIKEYTGRGTYIFNPDVALDLASDTVEFICKELPNWEPQYQCTTTLRWGGCNASQEIAWGVANLISYVEAARSKGVHPEVLIPKLDLHMTADSDVFEEVAKFRATRRLWAKLAQERFGTMDPRVTALRLTIYTSAYKLTAQEPMNNIVRTTMSVLAAILGGIERISAPGHDEALALPTYESTRLASLIKHILNDECYVGNTVDPLGGSYYIEHLTDCLEEAALKEFRKVQKMGGAMSAIAKGYYMAEMAEGKYIYEKQIESGERVVIGVNKYVDTDMSKLNFDIFEGDPETEKNQIDKLNQVRRTRDNDKVKMSLQRLKEVALSKKTGNKQNIVPAMIEAVRAEASVGEIFGVLRDVFGEYKPHVVI